MGTLLKFYEDISLNVTADKSHKNFHLVSRRVSLLLRFLESNLRWKLLAVGGNLQQNAKVVIIPHICHIFSTYAIVG